MSNNCCKQNNEYNRCADCGNGGCPDCLPLTECPKCHAYFCGQCLAPLRCEECESQPCKDCDTAKMVPGECFYLCDEHQNAPTAESEAERIASLAAVPSLTSPKERNRWLKSMRLVDMLTESEITSELAMEMDDSQWRVAASCAGVKRPSDKTKAVSIAILQYAEAHEAIAMRRRPPTSEELARDLVADAIWGRTA